MRKFLLGLLLAFVTSSTMAQSNVPVVKKSVTELRANKGVYDTIHLQSYDGTHFVGGGDLYLDASDTTTSDNNCNIFVDAVGHRYKRKDLTVVDITECGAYPAAADNTIAMQRGVDALTMGGKLVIPAYVSCWNYDTITITHSNVHVEGSGSASCLHKITTTRTSGINITGVEDTHISNITVYNLRLESTYNNGQTSSNTGGGVECQYADKVNVNLVWANHWADEAYGAVDCDDFSITNSYGDDIGQGVSSFGGFRPRVIGNYFSNLNLYYGIDIEGQSESFGNGIGAVVSANTVKSAICYGIQVQQYANSSVTGNTVTDTKICNPDDSQGAGIGTAGSPGTTITGNTSYDNAQYGFAIGPTSSGVTLVGNTSSGNDSGSLLVWQGGGSGYTATVASNSFPEGLPTISGAGISYNSDVKGVFPVLQATTSLSVNGGDVTGTQLSVNGISKFAGGTFTIQDTSGSGGWRTRIDSNGTTGTNILNQDGKPVTIGSGSTTALTIDANGTAAWGAHLTSDVDTVTALRANTHAIGTFNLKGYSSASDGGGGTLVYDPTDTTTADNNCTVFVDAGGRRYKRSGTVRASDCGVVSSTSIDNTAALQRFVNFISNSGIKGVVDCGIYHITDVIDIPFSQGWAIDGGSKQCVHLIQDTDNKGFFYFSHDLTWGWSISNFDLVWKNQQTTSDTSANCFYFTGASANFFNFRIADIHCEKGYGFFKADNSVTVIIFDSVIERNQHSNDMIGPFIDFRQNVTSGSSGNTFRDNDIRGGATATDTALVYLQGCNNCVWDGNVFGQNSQFPIMWLQSSTLSGHDWKVSEGSAYTGVGDAIDCNTGSITIQELLMEINDTATTGDIYGFAGNCTVDIQGNANADVTTAGARFYLSNVDHMRVGSISGPTGDSAYAWTNAGSTESANGLEVGTMYNPIFSADQGDADVTWTPGVSANTLLFDTPLTANRTVSIASTYNLSGNTCLTVVRTPAATGAFTLSINDASATQIAQITSGASGAKKVCFTRHAGFKWYQVSN